MVIVWISSLRLKHILLFCMSASAYYAFEIYDIFEFNSIRFDSIHDMNHDTDESMQMAYDDGDGDATGSIKWLRFIYHWYQCAQSHAHKIMSAQKFAIGSTI